MGRVIPVPFCAFVMLLLPLVGYGQSLADMSELLHPLLIEISPDGATLWYRIGQDAQLRDGLWETSVNSDRAPRLSNRIVPKAEARPSVPGSPNASSVTRSPDGKHVAWLDTDKDESMGPTYLYCSCHQQAQDTKLQPMSRKPILAFQWAETSNSFWVIAGDGPDEPVGHLNSDGHFEQITRTPAVRRRGGFVASGGAVAWVESDGSHYARIWTRDRNGRVRMRVELNPQVSKWTLGKQEVIRWRNGAGEELHGVLVRPNGRRLPLIVDPYSSGRNGFLNVAVMGNYIFVKEGFAVFLPNHRAPHTLPAAMFGTDYVGRAKDRDPVNVLVDDVMSGVDELIRRGIADPDRLFLYGFSNGASSVNQLLTQTQRFRAAVSAGGVADWLVWYRERFATAGDFIAQFLGGHRPEDSLDLYRRISPFYQVHKISTPLLLAIGDKDTRLPDTTRFYEALRAAGAPATLVTYPGDGHGLSRASTEDYLRRTLSLFRSAMKPHSAAH
ncbi:MAG TPA: prolyl oligopeptidase family serine peptidase [Terriglobia bacterium]|nr:prolyl oligopeptidase family serine peptidase [Terriglobia bacterium]